MTVLPSPSCAHDAPLDAASVFRYSLRRGWLCPGGRLGLQNRWRALIRPRWVRLPSTPVYGIDTRAARRLREHLARRQTEYHGDLRADLRAQLPGGPRTASARAAPGVVAV